MTSYSRVFPLYRGGGRNGIGQVGVTGDQQRQQPPDDGRRPLLIPEINPDHLEAVRAQKLRIGGKGFIVTNPNCTTIGLVFPIAALHRSFGLEAVSVVTMQAISGAGYPGVASLDILITSAAIDSGGEDRKVETEPLKFLGHWNNNSFVDAPSYQRENTSR